MPTGSLLRREDARIGRSVRRDLAGPVLVAIQAVDADRVERFKVLLPHPRERQPVEPGVVGDEADHALSCLLRDAPLRHAEEADIEIVQALALRPADPPGRAVRIRELPFFVHRHAGEAVVGRVAEDHEDRRFLLDPLRPVALFLQLGEGEGLGGSRLPAGQGIGEEYTSAFRPVAGERRVEVLHGQADLQMGNHEGGGHDLETEYALRCCLLYSRSRECAEAASFEVGGDAAQHFGEIGPGAAAGVEHVHVLRRESVPMPRSSFSVRSTRATM